MNEYTLKVVIEAVADKLNSVVDGVKDKLESVQGVSGKFADKLDGVSSKLGGAAKAMAPVSAAAGVLGGALVATAKKTADHTDEIDKMSQKLGMSRTAYQEWDYVLSQAGTDINSMMMGMKTMTNKVDDCARAGSTAGTAFGELGISWADLKGKSREDIFALTIERLQGCQDETKRAALANDLFGKSGQNLAPLLNEGAEATEALKQAARDYGFVLDDEAIDAGVAFTDAMDTMKRSLQTVGVALGTAVMPVLTDFCYFVAENIPKVAQNVRAVADKFNELPTPIRNLVPIILAVLTASAPALKLASMLTGKLAGIVRVAGQGAGLLGKMFALPPTALLIVGVIAAITAAFIYLYNTNEEFRAKMDETWAAIKAAMEPALASLLEAWQSVQPAVEAVVQAIASILSIVLPVLAQIIAAVAQAVAAILPIVASFIAYFMQVMAAIIQAVSEAIQFIMGLVQKITAFIKASIQTIQAVHTAFKTFLTSLWAAIASFVSGKWDAMKSKVQAVISAMKSIAQSLQAPVNAVFTAIGNHISSTFTRIQKAWQGLKNFASGVASGISNAFSRMVSRVKGIVNGFIGRANSAISVINSLPGVSVGYIPYLKHGTKNWAGGFAMMNEGGRGEMVFLPNGAQVIPHDVSMSYAKEAARSNRGDNGMAAMMAGMTNAILTGMQMNNQGGGEYHFTVELGGTRVAEQIFTLSKQGELIMRGA